LFYPGAVRGQGRIARELALDITDGILTSRL